MYFFKKNVVEDVLTFALYGENGDCPETNTTCNDYGCNIDTDVGVYGGCG